MNENEREGQIWLAFGSAAIAGLTQVLEEDEEGDDQLMTPKEIADEACKIADIMTDRFNDRFGPDDSDEEEDPPARKPRRRR